MNNARPYGKRTLEVVLENDWSWVGNLHEVREDGIWVKPLIAEDARWLSSDERATRLAHPTGDLDSPALAFPFNDDEFFAFYESCGQLDSVESMYTNNDDSVDQDALERLGRISRKAAELVAGLLARKYGIHVDGYPAQAASSPAERFKKRPILHEEAILRAVRDLGLNPKKLPPHRNGMPDQARKAVLVAVLGAGDMSESTFDRTWQALRRRGEVCHEAQPAPPPA